MVNFGRTLFNDFVAGRVVFVGTEEDAKDIVDSFTQFDMIRCPIVMYKHPHIPNQFFIGHEFGWHPAGVVTSTSLQELIILPWEQTVRLINDLSNRDIDWFINEFMESRAYININPLEDDISEVMDMVCDAITSRNVSIDSDCDSAKQYWEYLMTDVFRNLFIDRTSGLDINATSPLGIGRGHQFENIEGSMVFPIAYLAKKHADRQELYTDEDFSEIFN